MARKQKSITELKIERPERTEVSPKEALKRMRNFGERKEQFIAAVREGANRAG